ncbi:hypothetical protein VE02_09683 [Pseudogymnoascus sp. 03VT05]|nr:hypothetical protein VE02_09683 [Pseudogymnoascus sp. 03VT05]
MATIMEDANMEGDMANQEYPHDETRPLNILHLPMDILDIIFDQIDNSTWIGLYFEPRKNIQNARLVCRLFNQLASPHLCPELKVQLDQTSLSLVDEISRNPLIAAGVRTIHVVLLYHPGEVAENLQRFKNWRDEDIGRRWRGSEYLAADFYHDPYVDGDGTVHERPRREYTKAVYKKGLADFQAIISAWDKCFSSSDGVPIDAESLRYQEILRQGYEEYRQKHEEQFRLITGESFVNTLASAMARMRHCPYLRFYDKMEYVYDDYHYNYRNYNDKDRFLLTTDPEELPRLLVAPVRWRDIEGIRGGADLTPAKLLSELPIAIHKAGATISTITLHCFPTSNNYSMICPDLHDPSNPSWPDLRAACQHLTKFELRPNNQPMSFRHLLPEEQVHIDEYLCAMLSGQDIEIASLWFGDFVVMDDESDEVKGYYHIGAVLSTISWPRIKELRLCDVSFHQGELEAFFRGLGGGRIESVSIWNVELLSGSWVGALDILRKKLASRCLDGKCETDLNSLSGGEFGKRGTQKRKHRSWFVESDKESDGEESDGEESGEEGSNEEDSDEEDSDEEPSIFDQVDSYVSGVALQNPLSGLIML